MKFPVLMKKAKDASLYYFEEKNFGLVSKGGEKFYLTGEIIDSNGNRFKIKGVRKVFKANLLDSIRFFQSMKKVDLELEQIDVIELDSFKALLIDHINRYPKYWQSRDLLDSLSKDISSKETFEEIIRFLK